MSLTEILHINIKEEDKDFLQHFIGNKIGSETIVNKMSGDIMSFLNQCLNEPITEIDVRTLVNLNDLRKRLEQVPDGYLIFTHVTEIPVNEDTDLIINTIRACVKDDYHYHGSDIEYGTEYENHLAKHKIGIIVIVTEEEFATPIVRNIRGNGAYGGMFVLTDAD